MARRPIGSGPVDFLASMSPQVRDAFLCMPRMVGYNTTEGTISSATPGDVVTISNLNIPLSSAIEVRGQVRLAADGTNQGYLGFKINSTIVNEANSTDQCGQMNASASAQGLGFRFWLPGREDTNYYAATLKGFGASYMAGAAGLLGTRTLCVTNAAPNAVITSIAIRAARAAGTVLIGIRYVEVWEWPRPPFALP